MQIIGEWFQNFIALMSTFRVADVIDILIITILIYSILKLIRDTRAEQLLKGIIIILIIYALALIIDLTMTTSILKVFLESSVVLIVIIFQPELRKALEQLGRSKLSKGYLRVFQGGLISDLDLERDIKAISDVADSAVLFSHTKTGALFVFERETKLNDIAATGTELNCDTSTAMFGNLFFNKAPLHDGACILRSGRIYAAGCILPLNSKDVFVTDIGTRHRAAIGMSEVSDAVVVVVSEETGTISVAVNGSLERGFERELLVSKLEELLLPQEQDKPERKKRKKSKSEKKSSDDDTPKKRRSKKDEQ